ncbi:unnamed protein product [Phytophthora fragariaefolia]|uniref:Unnamed protein product n=1 Tax=Phytophthora fragariaefolia TaxID=1490495 RepID=A0A9W6YB60_9STRA|nr:unnamed protein product [Phytophthora fragariaefolia]
MKTIFKCSKCSSLKDSGKVTTQKSGEDHEEETAEEMLIRTRAPPSKVSVPSYGGFDDHADVPYEDDRGDVDDTFDLTSIVTTDSSTSKPALDAKIIVATVAKFVAGLNIRSTSTLLQHALMNTFGWATCSVATIHCRKHYNWQKAIDISHLEQTKPSKVQSIGSLENYGFQ